MLVDSPRTDASGHPSAELIVHAARTFGITLVSPLLLDNSAQARVGAGYTPVLTASGPPSGSSRPAG
jgi:hypothetical protein